MAIKEEVTPTNSPVNPTGEQATPSLLTEDIIGPSPVDTTVDPVEEIRAPLKADETKTTIEPVIPQEPIVTPEPVKEAKPTTIEVPKEDITPIKTEEEIRKDVEESMVEKSTEQIFAEQNSVSFKKNKDGTVTFDPANLDEAIDLFAQFGPTAKIAKGSKEAIAATKVFQKYSKYKGGTVDTYMDGLKSGEIATGGATWERLVKMNGGQPTDAMLAASAQYDTFLKTNAINANAKELYKSFGGESDTGTEVSEVDKTQTSIDNLDQSYLKTKVNMFENIEAMYKKFQQGSEATNDLRKDAQETAGQMDELRLAKRKIIKNIKKRFPNLPLSAQLTLARQETEVVDDQLFVLQRDYSNQFADYQYADTKDKSAFDFNVNMLDQKNKLVDTLYGQKRGDMIREDEVARQEVKLSNEIARQEKLLDASIKRNDKSTAVKQAHDLALLKMKSDLNAENKDKFSTANVAGGGVLIINKQSGEYEVVGATEAIDGVVGDKTVSGTGTGVVTQAYGATSPVAGDNVKLATGKVGTPGIDIDGKIGDPINAFVAGEVVFAGSTPDFGNKVVIKDSEGRVHAYNHLDEINTKVGATVGEGDVFATMGNTGTVIKGAGGDGSHLDYRVSDNGDFSLKGGNWIDPTGFTSTTPDTGFSENRLARNTAIDLFLGGSEIKKTTGTRIGANVELVDQMGDKINTFRDENIDLVRKFEAVTGESSKTSDKEQVKNFNRAIGEAALGDGDLGPLRTQIRNALLDDKDIFDELAPALDVNEQSRVIQELFSGLDLETGLTTATGNAIAKTVGREINEDITSIDQLSGKMLAAYVKSISGVAVSEPEYVRLASQLPSLKDQPERFGRMLENFRKTTVKSGTVRARTKLNDNQLFLDLFPEFGLGATTETKEKAQALSQSGVGLSAGIGFRNYIQDVSPNTSNTPVDSYLDSLQLIQ